MRAALVRGKVLLQAVSKMVLEDWQADGLGA
jgi:hypothetical protein